MEGWVWLAGQGSKSGSGSGSGSGSLSLGPDLPVENLNRFLMKQLVVTRPTLFLSLALLPTTTTTRNRLLTPHRIQVNAWM